MSKLFMAFGLSLLLSLGGVLAGGVPVDQQKQDELQETIFSPLFVALQAGDLDTLKQYMHPGLYREYKVLFEQNPNYGQFLRDYYQDAAFELLQVSGQESGYVGTVAVNWPDGKRIEFDMEVVDDRGQVKLVRPSPEYE